MQMARLWDTSRLRGYSLESLSTDLLAAPKTTIKDRFGKPKAKIDGSDAKEVVIPPLDELQRNRKYVKEWIDYSTYDTESTWQLRNVLEEKLRKMVWTTPDGYEKEVVKGRPANMWDFYETFWLPFGKLLTDMERVGFTVDVDYLKQIEVLANEDVQRNTQWFVNWARSYCHACEHMNPMSDSQVQQLLFAPYENRRYPDKSLEAERSFKVENVEGYIEPGQKKAKKQRDMVIRGLGLPPTEFTDSGLPAVSTQVLRELAGTPRQGQFGRLKALLDKREGTGAGQVACEAIDALCEARHITGLLNSFIEPLQTLVDSESRIHSSLNINTETGRLSSRRPNLQNQPALDKDRYKIRSAFMAPPGKKLIAADYGQLELRLLAHMTKCQSMLEAFRAGGDFHSRTALGMYAHIKESIDRGECLLEWDGPGSPPVPLLKDVFGNERRKAKVLNFSIAYGKTAMGLQKDWGVTLEEATKTLELWYADRPEVRQWQRDTIELAREIGATKTLAGRYRLLPDINSPSKWKRGHAERAAINTPLQGGASDVVVCAMLKLAESKRLAELGWIQVLQIHDEIILEGPEETAEEAREIVNTIMQRPLPLPLLVDLVVDAKIANTWYEAK